MNIKSLFTVCYSKVSLGTDRQPLAVSRITTPPAPIRDQCPHVTLLTILDTWLGEFVIPLTDKT